MNNRPNGITPAPTNATPIAATSPKPTDATPVTPTPIAATTSAPTNATPVGAAHDGEKLSYEEVLARNGTLIFTPGGTSMQPLLKHLANPVLLVPVEGRLKKGDVPFYKRPNGQYVLHRILKVRKDTYDCCGDNQVLIEKGVTDEMIFAKMAGFYENGVYISVDEKRIVRYARRRMASRPFRRILLAVKHRFKKLFHK